MDVLRKVLTSPVTSYEGLSRVIANSAVAKSIIEPAATFATLTYETNSGLVRLVSAGVHGLTAAVAVGKSVYVSWAGGTGVNGLYAITALDSDSTGVKITINLAHAVGLGTPTVAVLNTEVTLASIALPPLAANSQVEIRATFSISSSTSARTVYTRLNTTQVSTNSTSAANATIRIWNVLCNRGATNSQVCETSTTFPTSTTAVATAAIDTSAATTLTLSGKPAAANEFVQLESYTVSVLL
jgi:hypothetical protein